jgi:formylmethanofuran dehydrogenase subunit B
LNAVPSIACPFCGLVCDDLLLEAGRVDSRGCAKGAAGFARSSGTREHRVAGHPATFEAAVAAAATLLGGAQQPLITGLGADIAGLRALLALADRIGAIVDRWQSAAQLSNLAVVQRAGALAATFGEIANRADVVLLLGRDPAREHPRLFERLLRNRTALYRSGAPWVSYLGPAALAPRDIPLAAQAPVEASSLIDALGALAAMVRGKRVASTAAAALPLAALGEIAQRLKAARYGAILWEAAAFSPGEAQIAIGLVLHILRVLNLTTRCVGLPLGGGDNAQGASQAMLWQAGWPGRISFAAGTPEHDPWRFDAERLLAAREVDALLWVAALSPTPPPATTMPTVALVAPDVTLAAPPAVEIRIGVSALDHAGAVVRADTVIALPLAAARPSALPSVAAAAAAIHERIGAAR